MCGLRRSVSSATPRRDPNRSSPKFLSYRQRRRPHSEEHRASDASRRMATSDSRASSHPSRHKPSPCGQRLVPQDEVREHGSAYHGLARLAGRVRTWKQYRVKTCCRCGTVIAMLNQVGGSIGISNTNAPGGGPGASYGDGSKGCERSPAAVSSISPAGSRPCRADETLHRPAPWRSDCRDPTRPSIPLAS
jgi:hypothetical protein